MTDFIIGAVVFAIIGSAAAYIVRAKRRGVKCIGCPDAACCPRSCSGGCNKCGSDTTPQ